MFLALAMICQVRKSMHLLSLDICAGTSFIMVPLWPVRRFRNQPMRSERSWGRHHPLNAIPMVCQVNQRGSTRINEDQPSPKCRFFVIIYFKLPVLILYLCTFRKTTIRYNIKKEAKWLNQTKCLCSANVLCA